MAAAAIVLPEVADDRLAPLELLGGPAGSLVLVPLRTSCRPVRRAGRRLVAVRRAGLPRHRRTADRGVRRSGRPRDAGRPGPEDRSRLAVFEDRDRIGRDLHDLVIQRLFAIGLTLENASRLAERPEVATRLSTAVDDIDATIKDIRRTIFELSAPPESRPTCGPSWAMRSRSWRRPLGFLPHLHTVGPVDAAVADDVRGHLLAVLREALSNAARHAAATAVEVMLGGRRRGGAHGAGRRRRLPAGRPTQRGAEHDRAGRARSAAPARWAPGRPVAPRWSGGCRPAGRPRTRAGRPRGRLSGPGGLCVMRWQAPGCGGSRAPWPGRCAGGGRSRAGESRSIAPAAEEGRDRRVEGDLAHRAEGVGVEQQAAQGLTLEDGVRPGRRARCRSGWPARRRSARRRTCRRTSP